MAIRVAVGSRQQRRCRPPTRLPTPICRAAGTSPSMSMSMYILQAPHVHIPRVSIDPPPLGLYCWFVLALALGAGAGPRIDFGVDDTTLCVLRNLHHTRLLPVFRVFCFSFASCVVFCTSPRRDSLFLENVPIPCSSFLFRSYAPPVLPNPARTRAPPSSHHLPFSPFLPSSTEYKYHSHFRMDRCWV